jgi:hypothetical protein
MSMQNLSPEERKTAFTSEFSTLVSRGVHEVIPWDRVTLSPQQIQYAVNGFGGWIGATLLEGADAFVRASQGKEATDVHWSKSLPMKAVGLSRLVDPYNERIYTKFGTQFYYMSREMNRVFNDMRELRELGEIERARSIGEKKKLALRYRKTFGKIQRRATKYNNQIARITADPKMDGDLKRVRINRLTQMRDAMLRSAVQSTPVEIRY